MKIDKERAKILAKAFEEMAVEEIATTHKESMMQQIKFNHNYKKLHNQKTGVLIWVEVLLGKYLPKVFIDYDTDGKFQVDPKQKYLLLYFMGNRYIPFTTLRKDNVENRVKYLAGNKVFKIVIDKKEEPLPNHWVPMGAE